MQCCRRQGWKAPPDKPMQPCGCSTLLWDALGSGLHQCADTGRERSQSSLSQVGSHSFVFPLDGCSVFPNYSISYCDYTTRHHPERMVQDCFKKGLFVKMLLWQADFVGNLGSSRFRLIHQGSQGMRQELLKLPPFSACSCFQPAKRE